MESIITITLNFGEVKKTTVSFIEKNENEFYPDVIGTVYLPKSTVAELIMNDNYQPGKPIIVEIGNTGDIKLIPELPVKTMTVKFNEETVSEFVPAKIGKLYIPKSTLEKIGYPGDAIYMTIKVAE